MRDFSTALEQPVAPAPHTASIAAAAARAAMQNVLVPLLERTSAAIARYDGVLAWTATAV